MSEHPLLPAGRPIPVLELDFFIANDKEQVMNDLVAQPIKLEYWGGSRAEHEIYVELIQKDGHVEYVEVIGRWPLKPKNYRISNT